MINIGRRKFLKNFAMGVGAAALGLGMIVRAPRVKEEKITNADMEFRLDTVRNIEIMKANYAIAHNPDWASFRIGSPVVSDIDQFGIYCEPDAGWDTISVDKQDLIDEFKS